ncbi:MAG: aminotransferase class I/II-fold pyridoxal phosphate-dependent enzyme [Candidatus Gastranaerophilales bacterium]|nr:aminotransferase class I/II-fold pyridoxal phosphate-dependent enzyme [Candidatus Gastranaerophilales bacterium]
MSNSVDIKSLYSEQVKTLGTYIMFRIKQDTIRLTPELTAKGRKPIDLSIGAPVQSPPKFVIDALKNCLDIDGIHSYSTPKGELFYLEAVAKRMENRFGVKLDPKTEIISLIGSKEGLNHIFKAMITPSLIKEEKDIILIPDPGYASYKEQIRVLGGEAFSIPLTYENEFMPKPEQLIEKLKLEGLNPAKIKAMVINYPNNPLGATATREYLQNVVDFCKSKNILLVSDLAYADMYFEGQEAPASILEFEGAKDIAIEFHSLSKPYAMTGWRIGWACGNVDAITILGKVKATVDTGLFKVIQKAASEILVAPEGDEYIKQSNVAYQRKQEILTKGFRELGWDIDNLIIPKATFYLWLPIPARYKTSEEFTSELLEKSGIVVVPGTGFGKYGEGFFRISIVSSDENLYEMIERMKQDGFYFE